MNKYHFFYKNNIYKLKRPNGEIYFEMELGSHWARISWKQNDLTLIDLTLENIVGIEIEKRNGREYLVLNFHEDYCLKPLLIKTKPEISFVWGTKKG